MTKANPIAKALRTPKFRSLVVKDKKKEYVRKAKHKIDLTKQCFPIQ